MMETSRRGGGGQQRPRRRGGEDDGAGVDVSIRRCGRGGGGDGYVSRRWHELRGLCRGGQAIAPYRDR
jgi:hypothetical protein